MKRPPKSVSEGGMYIPAPLTMNTSRDAEQRFTLASTKSTNDNITTHSMLVDVVPSARPRRPFTSHGKLEQIVAQNAAETCDELDRRMDALVLKRERVDTEKKLLRKKLHLDVEEGKQMLPLDFLFERNMREYAHKRGGSIVLDAMKRFVNALASDAILIWKEFVAHSRGIEREKKAIIIQSFGRMVGTMRAARVLATQMKAQHSERKVTIMTNIASRRYMAIQVQRIFRGYVGRKEREYMYHRLRCIVAVQSLWRARKCKLAMEVHKLMKRRRRVSATKIQSTYRGYIGRMAAERQRKLVKHSKLERKLNNFDYVVGRRFAETGAATVIQRNWRKVRSKETIKFEWHEHAIHLQAAFRGMRDRRLARAKREKKEWDHYVWANRTRMAAATIMVQRRYRIWQSRKRLKSLRDVAAAARTKRLKEKESLMAEKLVKVGVMGIGVNINVTKGKRLVRGLNIFRRKKRPRSAIILQSAWRAHVARMRAKKFRRKRRKERYLQSAIMMQAAMRGLKARIRVKQMRKVKATKIIQAHWRGHKHRRMMQGNALKVISSATRIAAAYRRRKTMSAYALQRDAYRLRIAATMRIQTQMRVYLAKRAVERVRELLTIEAEFRYLGRMETTYALQRAKDRLYLGSIYKSASHVAGELQNLLATLCTSGDFSANQGKAHSADMRLKNRAHMLENTKLAKFCKAVEIQHPDQLPPQNVDILFAEALSKCRTNSAERRLNFKGFVYFLTRAAERRYGKIYLKEEETKRAGNSAKKGENEPPLLSVRGFEGQDACFLRFTDEHLAKVILSEHSDPTLKGKSMRQALSARARQQAFKASQLIQRIWKGVHGRQRFARVVEAYRAKVAAGANLRAALLLQRTWRGHAAIGKMKLLTQQLYKCYIDGDSGMPYWENQITKVTTWTRPFLLRGSDVDEIIRMPTAEDAFIVKCTTCKERPAQKFCVQCEDFTCSQCHENFHSKGKRRASHEYVPVDVCVECKIQVATRICTTCDDNFCDTCFLHTHRTGALSRHTYSPLLRMCTKCPTDHERRAGRYFATSTKTGKVAYLCTHCKYKIPQAAELPFKTLAMIKRRDEEVAQLEKERAEEEQRAEDEKEESRCCNEGGN